MIFPALGFKGYILPAYPLAKRFDMTSCPALPGESEAPMIATLSGSRSAFRSPNDVKHLEIDSQSHDIKILMAKEDVLSL
jgi:hypothetical protein